jgi:polar amino acid transport system substrate-binding protein
MLALMLLLPAPAWAGGQMVLSSGMHEPWTTPDGSGYTTLFVSELFQRLGMTSKVVFNPAAARALALANEGVDDGLAARIAGLEKEYPNLVRVPEPIFMNDFVAGTVGTKPRIRSWADLPGHAVGYILGWQIFEHNLPPIQDLTIAKDSKQLFGLLKSGRLEVILHERWQAVWQAREQGVELAIQEPPLVSTPMYMYVHRKHAALVPRIAIELAAMKAEGRDKAIMAQVLARGRNVK